MSAVRRGRWPACTALFGRGGGPSSGRWGGGRGISPYFSRGCALRARSRPRDPEVVRRRSASRGGVGGRVLPAPARELAKLLATVPTLLPGLFHDSTSGEVGQAHGQRRAEGPNGPDRILQVAHDGPTDPVGGRPGCRSGYRGCAGGRAHPRVSLTGGREGDNIRRSPNATQRLPDADDHAVGVGEATRSLGIQNECLKRRGGRWQRRRKGRGE